MIEISHEDLTDATGHAIGRETDPMTDRYIGPREEIVAGHTTDFGRIAVDRAIEIKKDSIREIANVHAIGHETIRETNRKTGRVIILGIEKGKGRTVERETRNPPSVGTMRSTARRLKDAHLRVRGTAETAHLREPGRGLAREEKPHRLRETEVTQIDGD